MPHTETVVSELFFNRERFEETKVHTITKESLQGMDDGELFLEYTQSESFTFDDGVLKNANYNTGQGFGLRSVLGETTGYAISNSLDEPSLIEASSTVTSIKKGYSGTSLVGAPPLRTNRQLYIPDNPIHGVPFAEKIELLESINHYVRSKDSRVKQVSLSLAGEWQAVHIIRAEGEGLSDIRPLVRLNISVMVEKDGRMERGTFGSGGRILYNDFFKEGTWQHNADEAIRQALVNLEAVPAPAGEMPVILGAGWPGVLLHESIGHGLEGDFNRKKTSAFSELIGKQVAAKGVTVIDDGTIENRRGSLTIDDEGTPTNKTVLIEDGILKGYMHDRLSARMMGVEPTGNGRRESFAHQPLPRMTNTYMLGGNHSKEEMIASVKKGIYAPSLGGGQVDITSGKFVFSASEAYLIEDGKITQPLKEATLIGNGPDVLTKIKMIGNDMALDPGIGTCGKAGQGVPVGVGQPSMLIEGLTVGGTNIA